MSIEDTFREKIEKTKTVHKIIPVKITNLNTLIPIMVSILCLLSFIIISLTQYTLIDTYTLDKFCRLITEDNTATVQTTGLFNKRVICVFSGHIVEVSKYSKTKTNINKIYNNTNKGDQ